MAAATGRWDGMPVWGRRRSTSCGIGCPGLLRPDGLPGFGCARIRATRPARTGSLCGSGVRLWEMTSRGGARPRLSRSFFRENFDPRQGGNSPRPGPVEGAEWLDDRGADRRGVVLEPAHRFRRGRPCRAGCPAAVRVRVCGCGPLMAARRGLRLRAPRGRGEQVEAAVAALAAGWLLARPAAAAWRAALRGWLPWFAVPAAVLAAGAAVIGARRALRTVRALRDLLIRDGWTARRAGGRGDPGRRRHRAGPAAGRGRRAGQTHRGRRRSRLGRDVRVKGTVGPVHGAQMAVVVTDGSFTVTPEPGLGAITCTGSTVTGCAAVLNRACRCGSCWACPAGPRAGRPWAACGPAGVRKARTLPAGQPRGGGRGSPVRPSNGCMRGECRVGCWVVSACCDAHAGAAAAGC